MRYLKFRFWSIDNKEMVSNESINKDHAYRYLINKSDERRYIIPMQFTGLKDANEIDIYEGDILSHGKYRGSSELVGQDCLYVVEYDIETASFSNYAIKEMPKRLCQLDETGEIIGNIYENPELLTN